MTPRSLTVSIAAAAVACTLLPADAAPPRPALAASVQPSPQQLLGAIDHVPRRDELDAAMGPATEEGLIQLATGSGDVGVRLRAIRALGLYPSEASHDTLASLLATPDPDPANRFVLRRAVLEALAEVGGPGDVALITPFLDFGDEPVPGEPGDGRDVRAAAAHALRVLGEPVAVPALRARQRIELDEQVQFAITEALRALL